MRISDWSSDVCSSDLLTALAVADVDGDPLVAEADDVGELQVGIALDRRDVGRRQPLQQVEVAGLQVGEPYGGIGNGAVDHLVEVILAGVPMLLEALEDDPVLRSEEHTSELQSLMRISYAVFCLKKKKTQTKTKACRIPENTNEKTT